MQNLQNWQMDLEGLSAPVLDESPELEFMVRTKQISLQASDTTVNLIVVVEGKSRDHESHKNTRFKKRKSTSNFTAKPCVRLLGDM